MLSVACFKPMTRRLTARRNLLTNKESVSHTLFAACVIHAMERARFQRMQQGRPCGSRTRDQSVKPVALSEAVGIIDHRFANYFLSKSKAYAGICFGGVVSSPPKQVALATIAITIMVTVMIMI